MGTRTTCVHGATGTRHGQAPPAPLPITVQSLWQRDGCQRKPPPRPCCFSTAPGAAGSRRTPAAAGGADGRCSWAASGCSWWPSGKRQRMPAGWAATCSCPNVQGGGQMGEPKMQKSQRTQPEAKPGAAGTHRAQGRGEMVSKTCQHPWSWGTEMEPRGQAAGECPVLPGDGRGRPAPCLLPSCGSAGTAGDTGPGWDTFPSAAPAGTTGRPSSAGPACTEARGKGVFPRQ